MGVDQQQQLRNLEQATRAFRRAEEALKRRRKALHEVIAATVESGISKSEVGRRTGYTREYVAKILETLPGSQS